MAGVNKPNKFLIKYDAEGNLLWAKGSGEDGHNIAYSVITDPSGNIYQTGYFLDSIVLGSATLTSSGTGDMFIVKYDTNGNVLWAKKAGGGKDDCGNSVATDTSGNVYIVGYFESTSIVFDSITLNNSGYEWGDMFIVKYSPSGNVIWAKNAGGGRFDAAQAVTIDPTGNIYVAGWFRSPTIVFGAITLTHYPLNYWENMFLTKYDADGNVLWAKSAGEDSTTSPSSIVTDTIGNIYVTGYFYSSDVTFDSFPLHNEGYNDMFLVKYDFNGNVVWAKRAGSTGNDRGTCVKINPSGNICLSGYFGSASITFGTTQLFNLSPSFSDVYIANYDSNGNPLWAESVGGNYNDEVNAIVVDASGNIYATGYYESSSIKFGTDTLLSSAALNMFIAKFSTSISITEKIEIDFGIDIYPNPTSGIFIVNLKNKTDVNICVYDLLGNRILKKDYLNDVNPKINLSCQPRGIYFMEIVSDHARIIKKIALE